MTSDRWTMTNRNTNFISFLRQTDIRTGNSKLYRRTDRNTDKKDKTIFIKFAGKST